MPPNTQLLLNEDGMLAAYMFGDTSREPLYTWTYDDFQIHAGPYKVTPSVYAFLANWLQANLPLEAWWSIEYDGYTSAGTEYDAVQAYFSMPFIEHEIMHNQMLANLEMTRSELLRTRHEYIMADLHLQNMDFPREFTAFAKQLIRNIERKIQIIERDIIDERDWCSYY